MTKMGKFHRSKRMLWTGAAALGTFVGAVSLWAGYGQAQLDVGHAVPGVKNVIGVQQSGKLVGFAWTQGDEEVDPCSYTEHWYLSADYVYPGSPGLGQRIRTVLRVWRNAPDVETSVDFFNFAEQRLGVGKRIEMMVFEEEPCGAHGFEPL